MSGRQNGTCRICSRCVMDTTDENLTFDASGVCSRCRDYETRIARTWNLGQGHEKELAELLRDIRKAGRNKPYDCILGLSGGLDSSYLVHMAVREWGLRPFVLHVDAGWDLPETVSNLERLCDGLGLALHWEKVDFEDMRRLQLAYFRTGLPDLDVPQDHAFTALVDRYALKIGVKYILNGYNIATEVVADPAGWSCVGGYTADRTYLRDVLRRQGGGCTRHYPYTTGFHHKFWMPCVRGVRTVHPLNLVPVTREKMEETLKEAYGFVCYRQKHFEDMLTKFLAGCFLPARFGYDIRKAQLSSLVITGQMTRGRALDILSHPPLTEEESRVLQEQVARKLKISSRDLEAFRDLPACRVRYKNNSWAFRAGIRLYTVLGLDRRIRK